MPSMAWDMRPMASVPWVAASCAAWAEVPAVRALSALSSTVRWISCMVALVSSRLAACSEDVPARASLAPATCSVAAPTCPEVCARVSINSSRARRMPRACRNRMPSTTIAPTASTTATSSQLLSSLLFAVATISRASASNASIPGSSSCAAALTALTSPR